MDIKKITEELNTARIAAGNNQFTYVELQSYLRKFNLPSDTSFVTRVFKLLDENKRFPENPIHINLVTKLYEEVREIRRMYNNNSKKRKAKVNIKIEDAIAFLKENGYKIYKPTISYDEI